MLNLDLESDDSSISIADRQMFATSGFVHLKKLFSGDEILQLNLDLKIAQQQPNAPKSPDVDRPGRKLWMRSNAVADFVFDPRVGGTAAFLLGTNTTRLIEDILFQKSGSVKATPWHRDSDFWAFSGGSALTMWIPLQSTPAKMALRYVPGSHRLQRPRVLHRYEKILVGSQQHVESFDMELGDVAIHHYRTLHSSQSFTVPFTRRAFAIHIIDGNARFDLPQNRFQMAHNDRCGWSRLPLGSSFPQEIAPKLFSYPDSPDITAHVISCA